MSFPDCPIAGYPAIHSLYIHIPFCKKKCNYCDFVSYAGKEDLIDDYVDKIIKEFLHLTFDFGPLPLKTLYFGGGTPTLLEPKHFDKILKTLTPSLRSSPLPMGEGLGVRASEVSIEANPGTADRKKLEELRRFGINRLSIGVQSFNDRHLKTLGRIHSAKDAVRFYEDARSAGFDNVNLDLMFALPGQTFEEWEKDLKTAVGLKPEHLSTYNLQIEEGTPLYASTKQQITNDKQSKNTKFKIPNEDEELEMYEYTIEILSSAGYKHYEISNFAKPGHECKHNINYWKMGNWLGTGAGAHSQVEGKIWENPETIEKYVKGNKVEHSSTARGDSIFMGLRLLDGLPMDNFSGFENEVKELLKDGLLEKSNGKLRLSRHGLFLGNLVFEKFI